MQPGPPENVSLVLEVLEGNPYLHVQWRPPSETDVSSGWVTVIYQLRVKSEGQQDWEVRTDRQTERQTDRQTERQRETDRQAGR